MGLLPTLLTIHPANPRPSPLAPLLQSPPSTLSPRRQTPSLQSEQPRENQQLVCCNESLLMVVISGSAARSHRHCPSRHAAARPRKVETRPPLRSLGHRGGVASPAARCVLSDRAAAGPTPAPPGSHWDSCRTESPGDGSGSRWRR